MKIQVRAFNYNDRQPGLEADWYWEWVCPAPTCTAAGDIGKDPYYWLFDQVADHVDTYHPRKEARR